MPCEGVAVAAVGGLAAARAPVQGAGGPRLPPCCNRRLQRPVEQKGTVGPGSCTRAPVRYPSKVTRPGIPVASHGARESGPLRWLGLRWGSAAAGQMRARLGRPTPRK